MNKNIGVLTSGGDSSGMNAAIRAVTRKAIHSGFGVVGYESGYEGLIEGESIELRLGSVGGIIDDGGTFLGTARSKEFRTEEGRQRALEQLHRDKVAGLVVIGGDGSFTGARDLFDMGFPTVGVPATIDNDICGTDFSIGFDTCVNTILSCISKIRDTASAHERVFIMEVMGRESGWIALYAGLAGGADYILVPENVTDDIEDICRPIRRGHQRGKLHSVIVVAEGAAKGHHLGMALADKVGREVKVSVPGYIQRGGSPTVFDRLLASRLGAAAVDHLVEGNAGTAIGLVGNEIVATPLSEAISEKKPLDRHLLELADILAL